MALLLISCSALTRNPVPEGRLDEAVLVDLPGVRAWGDEFSPTFQQDLLRSIEAEGESFGEGGIRLYRGLALSGGGAKGAFGAGFLNGWTAAGTRPRFKIVTGVSTGALIAPLAFLGTEYDDQLKLAYTTVTTKDVLRKRKGPGVLRKESLADVTPLTELIAEWVDHDVLAAVADEHRRGRRLYVGTVHFDAQRPVVWNMGLIAASGHPQALSFFRKVLLASASIPVAFPPVYFEVEVDGARYDEMHVDGGVLSNYFFQEAMIDLTGAAADAGAQPVDGALYIIQNGVSAPSPESVKRRLIPIVQRSLDTMARAGSIGDLFRVWSLAQRDGLAFNYVAIPAEESYEGEELFDPAEMTRLYELGYHMAQEEDPWIHAPPGWERPTGADDSEE